jgi:transcriptional regulator with XRE-family HTH domain
MKFYKSYMFKDKDPVIDQLRTAIGDSGMDYPEVAERSDVSVSTLYNWFYGMTKRPQHATVMAVTRAIGYDWRLVRVAEAPEPAKLDAKPRAKKG